METGRQRGKWTGVGIFVWFATGFLWFFLSFAAMFNGVFVFLLLLLPAYALSGALLVWLFRLPSIYAAFSLMPLGATLGGLVMAGDRFELRVG